VSKLKTHEIIEHARFLVAYGDELEHEEGYDQAVSSLLDRAEDKVEALAYVVGMLSRSAGELLSRAAENGQAAIRYQRRREFLATMAKGLAQESLELAEKEGDDASAERFRVWLDADMVTRGYVLTMPSGAVKDRSDFVQRRWAEQVLTATVGDSERKKRLTEAVNTHDEPLLAARLLIRASVDRTDHLAKLAKELSAAAKAEADLIDHVKALAERRLEKIDGKKVSDSLGGWVRITKRDTAVAVHSDWNGKGKPKSPDVDKLPEEFVKTTREPKKSEIVRTLKAIDKAKADRRDLANKLAEANTDEEKVTLKEAIDAIVEPPAILGAKLHMRPSQFVATSK
jgi:hypothetical protein